MLNRCKMSALALAFAVALSAQAQAGMIEIPVLQDATIYPYEGNSSWNRWYDWVGISGGSYSSIFGFDVSALAGVSITDVTFNAYHNFNGGDGLVGAAIGSGNAWNALTVTSEPLAKPFWARENMDCR